jgi:hypothetical protein
MCLSRRFEDFGFEDEWRQFEMLDDTHDESGRDSSKERGENNSPDHVGSPLVAGKADGVARIVSGVMGGRDMRKTHAKDEKNTDDQRSDPGGAALVGKCG